MLKVIGLNDISLSIGVISSSIATAILAPTDVPAWLKASVEALTGLCTSLQRFVDFRGRSAWYFLRYTRSKGIALAMKYEGLKESDASGQLT